MNTLYMHTHSKAFLKEPTESFKQDEAKTQALRLKEKKIKTDFDALLQKFIDTPEEKSEDVEKALRNLVNFMKPLDGIPTGLKKKDIVRPCRNKKYANEKRRKIKATWTKECEIAYVDLIQIYNRKTNPDERKPE